MPTKNIVPRADNEGGLGTSAKRWADIRVVNLNGVPSLDHKVNFSAAAQSGFAADTYLVGSSIFMGAGLPEVGTVFHCIFDVSKTAAGTATPIITLRIGTGGAIGDSARCVFTFAVQTGVADTGTFEIWAVFRTVGSGASAVVQGIAQLRHNLSITGFGTGVSQMVPVTSAGFDSTIANSYIGLSINGGASAVWTIQLVLAELYNLNV